MKYFALSVLLFLLFWAGPSSASTRVTTVEIKPLPNGVCTVTQVFGPRGKVIETTTVCLEVPANSPPPVVTVTTSTEDRK